MTWEYKLDALKSDDWSYGYVSIVDRETGA